MNSFKRFSKEKLPDKECFYRSLKDETTGDNGEKLNDHVSGKEYLTCTKIWNKFNMKNMSDYHDTVFYCHVTYAFLSESTLYSCLNVKELLARNRREI